MSKTPFFIHHTAIVENEASLGLGCKIWHFSHLMPTCKLGEQCNIGQNVFIADGVELGKGVKVQNNVSIYEGVTCEDDVFLGPSVVFTNIINPRSFISRKNAYQKTLVRKGASIGANATIVCGVEIGEYALVGAGAVVTKNVLPFALMVGNPAKHVAWVSKNGFRLEFNEKSLATCPDSGEVYEIKNQLVKLVHP